MSLRLSVRWIVATGLLCLCAPSAQAHEPADRKAAEEAIHAAASAYVEALTAGDSQAMLAMWAEGGDVVDSGGNARPATEVVPAQAAARVAAAGNGQTVAKPPHVTDKAIRFITDDVAIEDGRVEATAPNGTPRLGRFTAIWVRQDGKWRLASIREVRLDQQSGALLSGLDWMVGTWSGHGGGANFEVNTQWNKNHTFLTRDLKVTIDGKEVVNGQQRIGIDPLDGQIRSWMYDHDGGHGEGVWTKHGDAWVVQATGVTADGRRTTGTNIYRPDGPDKLIWKSIGGTSAGQAMPDFEIELTRADSKPEKE